MKSSSFLKNRTALITGAIILLYIGISLAAAFGWIATNFFDTDLSQSFQPPSSEHWLGTDFLGRDTLARVIHGSKIALLVGFISALIATVVGLTLGAIAGFFGKWVDDIVVWIYTTMESIPFILLVAAFAFSLGQGLLSICVTLGLSYWVRLCRLTRGEFLKHKNQDYVVASQAIGTHPVNQIIKHILPNILHIAYIQFNLTFIASIKFEVILSFLGLGVEPGTPSWGLIINDAKGELPSGVWWNLVAATGFMFVLILSMNLFTEALRKHLDPKSETLQVKV